MSLLPRKGLLAIAAVVDVALQRDGRPMSAKTLAMRHGLPPRHLESVLQSLVHDGILKGIRGPGQMGNKRATQRGLEVVRVDAAENLLLVRGSVPGPKGAIVEVRTDG